LKKDSSVHLSPFLAYKIEVLQGWNSPKVLKRRRYTNTVVQSLRRQTEGREKKHTSEVAEPN
jgi:hypothetical protein